MKLENEIFSANKIIDIKFNNSINSSNNLINSLQSPNEKLENKTFDANKENGFSDIFKSINGVNKSNSIFQNGQFNVKAENIFLTTKTIELKQKSNFLNSNNTTFIGPLLPSSKLKNDLKSNGTILNGTSPSSLKESPIKTTPIKSMPLQNKRKRILSERGEKELLFPYIDCRIFKNNWKGCSSVVSDLFKNFRYFLFLH